MAGTPRRTVTESVACKRALFDRLQGMAGKGLTLAGVQVAYSWPGRDALLECVYGGGIRFTRTSAGHDGQRELWLETASIGLYVRVSKSGRQVTDTDDRAVQIGAEIETLLEEDPHLAGGFTYTGVTGGSADYSSDDNGPTTVLAYQVQFQYYLD